MATRRRTADHRCGRRAVRHDHGCRAALEESEELVVLAPFEPVPLEDVLGSQGFPYQASGLGGEDWQVTFRRGS